MGVGIVIRSHLGLMLATKRRYVDQVVNPELAEPIAMRCALQFAEEVGFQRIIVASDCATLTSKVTSPMMDRSQIGVVVFDIKSRAPKFESCLFTNVSWSCNMATHVLAKSSEHDLGSCWFDEVPEVIRNIVCKEQSLFV
ncbi:hypothetical protein ZWY2020_004916 [Hordeum vulgare]|nr:hypothetical protein ZWY2020_004916 [Hordeum vulgare]